MNNKKNHYSFKNVAVLSLTFSENKANKKTSDPFLNDHLFIVLNNDSFFLKNVLYLFKVKIYRCLFFFLAQVNHVCVLFEPLSDMFKKTKHESLSKNKDLTLVKKPLPSRKIKNMFL